MKPGTTRRSVLGVIAAAVAGLFSKGVLAVCGEATQSPSSVAEDSREMELRLRNEWHSRSVRIPDDKLDEFWRLSDELGFSTLPARNKEQWLMPPPRDWSTEAMREWLHRYGIHKGSKESYGRRGGAGRERIKVQNVNGIT